MNRSFHVTGSAAQCIKRQFLICDEVTNSVPLCSTLMKAFTDQRVENQLRDSAKTAIDENIRKDGRVQIDQAGHEVLRKCLPISDQCPADFKNLNLDAVLESLGTGECTNHVPRSNRKKRSSDGSARRRILSRSRRDVLYYPMTQVPVTSSVPRSLQKRWLPTRSFSVSAAVRSSSSILVTKMLI
jgi:hypothetical protein